METSDGWSIYNSVLYDLTLMFQGNFTVNENYFGANKLRKKYVLSNHFFFQYSDNDVGLFFYIAFILP